MEHAEQARHQPRIAEHNMNAVLGVRMGELAMIKLVAIVLATQATVLTSPPSDPRERSATSRVHTAQASHTVPSGTVDHPTLVDDVAIGTPEATIRHARQAQDRTARDGVTTYVPTIASIADPGCYKVAEHPFGYQVASSTMLNGRATVFQCRNFVTHVGIRDFSKRLQVDTAGGFPESALKAILNGGALTYWYRQGASGVRQAVFLWVGKTQEITIALESRDASFASLATAGNAIANGLTQRR